MRMGKLEAKYYMYQLHPLCLMSGSGCDLKRSILKQKTTLAPVKGSGVNSIAPRIDVRAIAEMIARRRPLSPAGQKTAMGNVLGNFDGEYIDDFDRIQRKSNPVASSPLGRTKGEIPNKHSTLTQTFVSSLLLLLAIYAREDLSLLTPLQLVKLGVVYPARARFKDEPHPPKKRMGATGKA